MFTTNNGGVPGLNTPTSDNGLTTPHSQPVKRLSKHKADFIAIWNRIKRFASGFYIVRGIGVDSLFLAGLIVIYLIWRAAA